MSLKARLQALWKDESAQGATEYILILVAVVSVAFIFRSKIKEFVEGRLGNLGSGLGNFNVEQQ
ncbi:MAG: hypothetical protein JNJ49_03110 [Bdellovibrionaceae bacterium]|nr:hypothetical protein [Pseudobdellovibrionaceae bacterium]